MASCKVMMCHFPAMCLSTAPSCPRRGPGFQFTNTEPRLFSRSVGHVFIEVISLESSRVFLGWCLTELCIGTRHISNMTPESGLRVRLYPGRKTHLVWTRHLPQNQIRSLRRETVKLSFWETRHCFGWIKLRARVFEDG